MTNLDNFQVPQIDNDDFLEALLRTSDTYGDLFEKVTGGDCSSCMFKQDCDKLFNFLEEQGVVAYCSDLVNIMTGNKSIETFI